jgi:hypothetical protein
VAPKPIITTRDGRQLATVAAAAAQVGVSIWTIHRRLAAGELTAHRVPKDLVTSGRGREPITRVDLVELDQLFTPIEAAS